jgi:hypothetical protein
LEENEMMCLAVFHLANLMVVTHLAAFAGGAYVCYVFAKKAFTKKMIQLMTQAMGQAQTAEAAAGAKIGVVISGVKKAL